MNVLMIQRARQFSPNSVEKDKAILDAVAAQMEAKGMKVASVSEEQLKEMPQEVQKITGKADVIFSMARLPEALTWLKEQSARVINAPEGIGHCARCKLEAIMARIGTPKAPAEGQDGYWLKRGDAAAQMAGDVLFAADKAELGTKIAEMQARGITSYVVSAHVKGDLVKFYGVRGTGFFRFYYPTDDGITKFGDELRNGKACHYAFDAVTMQQDADLLAKEVGIDVYGGDCIVRDDGSYCFIDFNDWPSFSRCREEAAQAIAALV